MLRTTLAVTSMCVAIVSGGITGRAQEAQESNVVIAPAASADAASVVNGKADLDPAILRSLKGGTSETRWAIGSARFLPASGNNRQIARVRSKKRIIAGAIAGGVGGFFAGGFLGAHIEGDRCDCDDPGVRGFLIGAPIGAIAGGISGAKFLFSLR